MTEPNADSSRSEVARRLAARLAHDLGKYVARTAHNVAPGAWTTELVSMLCRDLFQLAGGRASALLVAAAKPLEALLGPRREIAEARDGLAAIDGLEAALREGNLAAADRAALLALAVEAALRSLVRDLQKERP